MNSQTDVMQSIKVMIENEFKKSLLTVLHKDDVTHNHPPLRHIVKNCPYCEKYGNIFVT